MRVGELLRLEVLDAEGGRIGRVNDVRLVQDGPYVEGFGAALRVDGLVAGGGGVGTRLGFHRHRVTGPWALKKLFARLEHRARFVPWQHVRTIDRTTITLDCRAADLATLLELDDDR